MNVLPEIKKAVEDKVLECLLTLQSKLNNPNLPIPPISFKQMGRVAGRARWTRNFMTGTATNYVLEINPDYCLNGHFKDMIENTVPHEVAHIVSVFVYGAEHGKGHKSCWKHVMRLMGISNPERCHNYSMDGVKTRGRTVQRFHYTCNCGGLDVSTTIHNRIQTLHRIYRCRKCKAPIVWARHNPTVAQNS